MISRVWPPRIPMTNQRLYKPKAPRSSCRHVCGFKLTGSSPESGAFYTTARAKTEYGF
ncbi:FIG00954093: hypothetical protein [Pseudomonas sp. SHC52]|nr:FIG00954093: hypothetical protein [Pseudomonas sp. SHC52]